MKGITGGSAGAKRRLAQIPAPTNPIARPATIILRFIVVLMVTR